MGAYEGLCAADLVSESEASGRHVDPRSRTTSFTTSGPWRRLFDAPMVLKQSILTAAAPQISMKNCTAVEQRSAAGGARVGKLKEFAGTVFSMPNPSPCRIHVFFETELCASCMLPADSLAKALAAPVLVSFDA